MIDKVVKKRNLHDPEAKLDDLQYWLSQPPEARIEAVELLRSQHDGYTQRLQRVVRIVQRPRR